MKRDNTAGGGLGFSSAKQKLTGGGGSESIACSTIEFSILKQSKHRSDM
jgi:hypothetical protein